MNHVIRQALLWVTLYMVLALLPVSWLLVSPPAPRSALAEAGVLLGALALSIMALQALISGRHGFGNRAGFDNVLQFHRQLGIGALLLVLAHPTLTFIAEPSLLHYLDPREDTLRALALMALLLASLTLVVTSLWRKRLGLSYETWRLLHGGLTAFVVMGGLGHALMAQRYTQGVVTSGVFALLLLLPLGLLVETRLLRPWRLRRRPWRVVDNQLERGDTTTLTLEADGQHQLDFQPGQFFWITLGNTPFALQQHPFSIVSSASQPGRVAFSAKRLGDFTRTLPKVKANTRAFIEGPYGAFIPNPDNPHGIVMLAGGIGITPFISMLRSFRDTGKAPPIWLIYANPTWQEATFREHLETLSKALPLTVVHVLSDPHEGWQGETGYVDEALIKRVLPDLDPRTDCYICGPDPMMDSAERGLIAHGIPPTHIFSDRFDIV